MNWKFSPQGLSFFVRPLFLAGEQKKSILCALCVSVVNPILKRARTSSVIVVGFINRLGYRAPLSDNLLQGIETDAIGKLGRFGDIPEHKISVLSRFKGSDPIFKPEGPGAVAGYSCKGFFRCHSKQGAGHVQH